MKRLDLATLIGLAIAVGGILAGNALEGGHLESILQPTAALIVFGGTIGATLVSFPLPACLNGLKAAGALFGNPARDPRGLLAEIVRYAQKARKEGIISLEVEVGKASDPFLRRAILMAVDGVDSKTMHETLELELAEMDERGEVAAKVYEAAGGYAPTIGILGAVLGLIHVMSNLTDVGKVGEGIAVAFVATIYGVGSANIFFLPAGAKLKLKHREEMILREMAMHGAIAIQQGQNPKLIEEKLSAFVHERQKQASAGAESGKATPKAAAA